MPPVQTDYITMTSLLCHSGVILLLAIIVPHPTFVHVHDLTCIVFAVDVFRSYSTIGRNTASLKQHRENPSYNTVY